MNLKTRQIKSKQAGAKNLTLIFVESGCPEVKVQFHRQKLWNPRVARHSLLSTADGEYLLHFVHQISKADGADRMHVVTATSDIVPAELTPVPQKVSQVLAKCFLCEEFLCEVFIVHDRFAGFRTQCVVVGVARDEYAPDLLEHGSWGAVCWQDLDTLSRALVT